MKLFMIAAVCLAAAVSAEPEPWLAYGHGLAYGLAPGYLHQQTWPSAAGPLGSSTCYGCRRPDTVVAAHHYLGKRSAEPYYGYYGHPYAYGAYGLYGHAYGLRHAYGLALPALKALPAVAPVAAVADGAVAAHPGTATSFVARSPQGLRGKRSAEPYYGYYGHPYAYGLGYRGYGYGLAGVAGHPTGTSFVARSPQGLGK